MKVSKNKVVTIEYVVRDEKGDILDKTSDEKPFTYIHGHRRILPPVEKALEGKSSGEKFEVSIPPRKGFGERDESLVVKFNRSRLKGEETVKEGMRFRAKTEMGERIYQVTDVEGETVTADANHPLAGRTLNFEVNINDVRENDSQNTGEKKDG